MDTRRTKCVDARLAIGSNKRTDERMTAWDAVRLRVREALLLDHVKPGSPAMMFFDVSDKLWGAASPMFPRSSLGAELLSRTWPISCGNS